VVRITHTCTAIFHASVLAVEAHGLLGLHVLHIVVSTCCLAAVLALPSLVADTDRIGFNAVHNLDTTPAIAAAELAIAALWHLLVALEPDVTRVAQALRLLGAKTVAVAVIGTAVRVGRAVRDVGHQLVCRCVGW